MGSLAIVTPENRTVDGMKNRLGLKRKPRLQKRIKWIPPSVVEVCVTRDKGLHQYSSLKNASSFENAACNQPLFIWVEDEEKTNQNSDDSESWFESSDDSDKCSNELVKNSIAKHTVKKAGEATA